MHAHVMTKGDLLAKVMMRGDKISMKKIAILDFETASIEIKLLPVRLHNAESYEIEEWLQDNDYHLDEIQYMYGDISYSEEMSNTDLEKEDAELLASKLQ